MTRALSTKSVSAISACALYAGLLAGAPASAQSPGDFYKGKTVNVLIGVGVGGEYDLHARIVARHIGKHAPGAPNFVPQNMTGAGGAKMAAYLAEVAPKDGTNIGMIANNFPAMQAAGLDVIRFDLGKFQWIGSISPTVETMTVASSAGVSSIEEATRKEVIVGATGKGAITYSFPAMLNEFLGTKFKIVPGYPGGNQINLAMERGEVQARNNTWSSWKVTKPDWIKNGDIKILAYAGPAPKDLPGVPNVVDLVKSADDKRTVELIVSGTMLGRPLAFAGDVPADRVAAMRAAFVQTMKDPEFLGEAGKLKIEVDPVRGEDMQKVVTNVLATPKNLAARARTIIE